MESEKYLTSAINDGGVDPTRFELGNNLALNTAISGGSTPLHGLVEISLLIQEMVKNMTLF